MDTEGVRKARAEELEHVRAYEVYRKLPVKQCWERTGRKPIQVRWVDINKGDAVHPDYR